MSWTNRVKWYVDQAEVKDYDELKANHVSDYQNIFNRVDLDLGQTVVIKDDRCTSVCI